MVDLKLDPSDVALLIEALDSHIYWQLSDEQYRNSGMVEDPGSDDEDNADQIADAEALQIRLQEALKK